jgi:hypothetical protein
MAQALRVRREASTAEDAVHQPVLRKTLGNLDRHEAPLKALARLIHTLVPVGKGHKDTAETAAQPQPHHLRSENLHCRGRKIASAASRNRVMAGPVKH